MPLAKRDAMTDMNSDVHIISAVQTFPRIGELRTTREMINFIKKAGKKSNI